MVYTYTPTYYSSFQDTITSLCKSILQPFSLKNRRLPSDQKLAKRHSDNLKWQQESFHQILHLIGLHKEGIVAETDVSTFRSHLLDTLIASPPDHEPVDVIRDKLLFLQELLYAKCISADEYHSSKRPLLQRLAVQGAEIDCRDVIIGAPAATSAEEEWSVIELKDKEFPVEKDAMSKHRSPIKSLIGKSWRGKGKKETTLSSIKGPLDETPLWEKDRKSKNPSILLSESSPIVLTKSEKAKRRPFRALFPKEQQDVDHEEEGVPKSSKKQWGFDGLKKWKKSSSEDESATPYLLSGERSDNSSSVPCTLVASPIGEGPDTRRIKKKIHSDGSASDFFIDKVLGENIKKELSRIQSELSATNPNLTFSDDQVEAISTKLPVDKSDLNNFFPKPWCDRYGDIVLDAVKKEFKDHVGEMETMRNVAREKHGGSKKWVSFEENDENFHPNLFFHDSSSSPSIKGTATVNGKTKDGSNCFVNNPFHDGQNPFWIPRGGD